MPQGNCRKKAPVGNSDMWVAMVRNIGLSATTFTQARLHAESEFEKYRLIQDAIFQSDFDLFAKAIEDKTEK